MSSILLIEDNRDYAATLRANLEREGYAVAHAATGTDGLELARRTEPDLIILDLMLPAMSGFTVLQRLRDEGRQAPVLIMTALGTEEEKLRGFGLGADDYVVKPCGLLEILARVKALLRRSSGGASGPRSPSASWPRMRGARSSGRRRWPSSSWRGCSCSSPGPWPTSSVCCASGWPWASGARRSGAEPTTEPDPATAAGAVPNESPPRCVLPT